MTSTLFYDLESELIARGALAPMPVSASWSWNGGPAELGLIADFLPVFEAALAADTIIVGQNVAFDFGCIGTYAPRLIPAIFAKYKRGEIRDIGLQEKLLRYAVRGEAEDFYSLEMLCQEYGLPPVDKEGPWRLEFASLRNVPVDLWPAGARAYALDDADRPARIYAKQMALDAAWQKLRGAPVLHLSGEEAYKAFALHLIACKGLYTDPEKTLALKETLATALAVAFEVCKEPPAPGFAPLVRADGTKDMKAAAAWVIEACRRAGLPVMMTKPSKTHKQGQVATGKDVLEGIPDDLLTSYSVYSQASTYKGRVDDMCLGFTEPLQVRFNTMLETRRTSTSKPKLPLVGVQAQNFPRKLMIGRGKKSAKHPRGEPLFAPVGARECLRPPPGWVFIAADLPTAELRSVSQVCIEWFGASELAKAINAGKDVHCMLGGVINRIPYEVMMTYEKDPPLKEARDQAKPGNFGFWGGMKETSFISYAWKNYRLRLDHARAAEIRDGWCKSWPEHAPYFERARAAMRSGKEHSWFDKVTGERQSMPVALVHHGRTGYWRAKCGYCQWCNTQFQERTGAAAAAGLCEVQRRCFSVPSSDLYGAYAVAYTHDEIVGVCREEQADAAARELALVMRDEFNVLHPDVPILTLEPVVARVYSKSMKAVFDAAGRLVPWEPKT